MDWEDLGNGLQARSHETRKFGRRFDRYLRGRYQYKGKRRIVSFGWESEWVAAERARMLADGDTDPRMSFMDHCKGELARLKANVLKGVGPMTLKEDREQALAKQREEEEARKAEEQEALTFGEYFEKTYFPGARVSKKWNTCKQEWSFYTTWLKPNLGKLRLIDIRPLHVEGVKRKMVKSERAPRTIQVVLATARQCWNHARDNGAVSGDWPGRSVKAGRFDNRRMRFLTHEEAEALLGKLKETSEQVHNMAILSLDTGLRAGEIFALDWENVDIDADQIKVMDTKSGRNRVAYMTERVKTMLQSLPERKGLVFPSETGERIGQISATFMRAVDALGFNKGIVDKRNKVTFHTMRHTFASNLVAAGVNLYEVKELMGHSTLALTERYSHVRADNLRAAVRAMEQAQGPQAKVIELKR